MKLGLYGGSFDPIHYGHLQPVRRAREALGLDRILYLPTARPPHKRGRRQAPALARFTMVELALLEDSKAWVSSLEMEDEHVTYTVDTLRHFHRQDPELDLHLLVGSDSFLGLSTWHQWQEIPRLARIVIMARPGWNAREASPELTELVASGRAVTVPDAVRVEASSTEIRRRLAADEIEGNPPLSGLVPAQVLDYIAKYELYR